MSILSKICKYCSLSKIISEFYIKSSQSKGLRYDSLCKECRKNLKRKEYNLGKGNENDDNAKKLIDTGIDENVKNYRKSLGFAVWEKTYGGILSEEEKFEIKKNLTDLFSLLEEIEQGNKTN